MTIMIHHSDENTKMIAELDGDDDRRQFIIIIL